MKLPPKDPGLSVKDGDKSLKEAPQQGRPVNTKDSKQRQTKKFAPQTGAKLHMWSNSAKTRFQIS